MLPTHNGPEKLANDFNDFFIDKVTKIRKSIPSEVQDQQPYYFRPFTGNRLELFAPTSVEEVSELIKEFGFKTSLEDPIPAILGKESLDIIIPVLTDLINHSLSEGSMEGVKSSVIDPLLKKLGLDRDQFKNYRPVNKLEFISKITEWIALKRLNVHMCENSLHEPSQIWI